MWPKTVSLVPSETASTESLTSPVHAWHLYHAARYFDTHRDELARFAAGGPLSPLVEIIERLQHEIELSVSRYASVRLR